ncbi:MAG: family 20 glycosylhydrolase [Chlorobi bacterium]|nr:family 20 glycosylhydrolase [Chlorobiota bacterium]
MNKSLFLNAGVQRILKKVVPIAFLSILLSSVVVSASDLSNLGIHVIPYPQQVILGGDNFIIPNNVTILLDKNHSEADKFAAGELAGTLKKEWGVNARIGTEKGKKNIVLTRNKVSGEIIGLEGYHISTGGNELVIKAKGEAGLFYGVQTLLQIVLEGREGAYVIGMEITDWPDIKKRAAHYDTKHHQDKMAYVESFIKDLAKYKINQLVWEWEDKLAYKSHPEIGAPGAFTIEEMQEMTRFARKYHVELIPLVQGLGHVSFILKWPQYAHLREIESSNWEFCPLKEETYDLLFDLWEEAIEATPGSGYIHIGSDETYELAACEQCQAKAKEIGKSGLYQLFVNKAAEHLQKLGRKVMVWERPMGWVKSSSPAKNITPVKGLVLTESYSYNTPDFKYTKEARQLGYEVYAYDPNPGIEPLFLPYHYRKRGGHKTLGSMENSYNFLTTTALSGAFDGMINTSWDDSGLHNQMWMLSFVTSAEYSWSGNKPTLPEFEESFFKSYYGGSVMDMKELYSLLNEGAYYFAGTFERNVWHHGEIGKTHLPDLPRNDNMEYDPYWNTEYKEMVSRSKKELAKMKRAMQIIVNNKKLVDRNLYDFDLYESVAELIQHTCNTYLDLSDLERIITKAHRLTYIDKHEAYNQLAKARELIEASLQRRERVYNDIVKTWEETRLPKGMSTKDKKYFHRQDRARHFANRKPDMSYLIFDEQLLDMEGYLKKLKAYMQYYKETWLD